MDLPGASLGYEKITGLSVVKTLTVPTGASRAILQAETQGVRFRDDGTSPDSTTGMLLASGGSMNIEGAILHQMKFIEATASATLHVLYYS